MPGPRYSVPLSRIRPHPFPGLQAHQASPGQPFSGLQNINNSSVQQRRCELRRDDFFFEVRAESQVHKATAAHHFKKNVSRPRAGGHSLVTRAAGSEAEGELDPLAFLLSDKEQYRIGRVHRELAADL